MLLIHGILELFINLKYSIMKHFCRMMILSSMFLVACHDQMAEQYSEQLLNWENETLSVVYPLSKDYRTKGVRTRSITTTFETDWEKQSDITTALGNVFCTPWATGERDSNLPESFAYDIKKRGWLEVIISYIFRYRLQC